MNLNDWWKQRSSSEQRYLLIGGVALGLILLWLLVLAPLSNGAKEAREEYLSLKELSTWMQVKVDQLKKIKSQAKPTNTNSKENLLTLVERLLKENSLNLVEHELSQKDTNSVTLNFAEINYPSLMKWLAKMQEQFAIKASEAHIKRTPKEGMISANLVLSRPL